MTRLREMAGLYDEANAKIADGNTLLEAQLNLLSQQPSALDRISEKVSEQEDRLRRVKIAFQEALDPGKVQNVRADHVEPRRAVR